MFGEKNQFFEIKTFCHSLWKLDYHNFDYIDIGKAGVKNFEEFPLKNLNCLSGLAKNLNKSTLLYKIKL